MSVEAGRYRVGLVDVLDPTALAVAIKDGRKALQGDSNDAEHDALVALLDCLRLRDERPFLVTQTETFRVLATSEEEAVEKVVQMDEEQQGQHYMETLERSAEPI